MKTVLILGLTLILASAATAAPERVPGDCNQDGAVTVSELITSVRVVLGQLSVTRCCSIWDGPCSESASPGIAELIEAVSSALRRRETARPNILLIIGDDHAWDRNGFMGDPVVQTPRLDQLASEGTVFTHGFNTSSICGPSLRAMLSGLTSDQWERKAGDLPEPVVRWFDTLPKVLGEHGYATWGGGKFWEGSFQEAGFDEGMVTETIGLDPDANRTCCPIPSRELGRYGIDAFRDFLDGVEDDRPWFAWAAPMLPHVPFDAPAEFQLYPGHLESDYLANVSWLDHVVGELVDEIDERGLQDRTLIIYVSDNGWGGGDAVVSLGGRGKGSAYELGVRTPIVFRQPGSVPEGIRRSDLVSTLDLLPTLLSLSSISTELPHRRGIDLGAAVLNPAAALPGDRVFITRTVTGWFGLVPGGTAVRTSEWRYIRFVDGSEELYAINQDPFERDDVAARYPEVTSELQVYVDLSEALRTLPLEPDIAP